jgi:steroid delta-isomerase-like uncharacterized protein
MSAEDNKAAVLRFMRESNKGNLRVMDEVLAPDFVGHMAAMELHGPDAYKQYIARIHTALPDSQLSIDDIVADGDTVAVRATISGTNSGPFMDLPPTGKNISHREALFFRFSGGKATEVWQFSDTMAFYRQLGITLPPPLNK